MGTMGHTASECPLLAQILDTLLEVIPREALVGTNLYLNSQSFRDPLLMLIIC